MRNKSFLFLTLFFSIILFATQIYANTIHTVKKGDNLYSISKKYKVPASEIERQNNLSSKKLSLGMKLIIPTSNRASAKTISNPRANPTSDTLARSNTRINDPFDVRYHKVKKGETIDKIARKYSITTERLIEINGLTSKKLKPGQQILIKSPKPDMHIVKKGDTLWNIAVRYGISPDEIREINNMQDNQLKIGQKLLIAKNNAVTEENVPSEQLTSNIIKIQPEIASQKVEEVKALSKSDELSDLSIRERLVIFAKKMLHLPYRFGGNTPFGIDCSAYVQKVYSFIGMSLPRSAREQFHIGEMIDKNELSVGDLVFFRTYASFPSHVGIYLGNNLFIHASSRAKRITIDSLDTPYYMKRFIGAKKIISEEDMVNIQASGGVVAN